jgi:hypothetical protein
MALTQIKTGGLANNSVTNAKMADNAIDSVDIAAGSIDNAHLAGSIAVSKTLLAGGTGLTLSTNTLNVDAAQTQITSVGTLSSLATSGNVGVGSGTTSSPSSASRTLRIQHATGSASLVLCGDNDHESAWDVLADTDGALDIRKNNYSQLKLVGGASATFAHDVNISKSTTSTDGAVYPSLSVKNTSAGSGNSYANIVLHGGNGTTQFSILNDGRSSNSAVTLRTDTSSPINFLTNGSTALVLDTSQNATFGGSVIMGSGSYVADDHANFGVGAIVSNWGTAFDVLNVGHSSAVWCEPGDYADRGAGWGNNIYHNGSNYKPIYEDQASAITQKGGIIKFYTVGVKATSTNMTTPGDGDPRMTITSAGTVGIGDDDPPVDFVVKGSDPHVRIWDSSPSKWWSFSVGQAADGRLEIDDTENDNGVYMNQGATSWTSSSDERLKTNWTAFEDALSSINSLTKVGTFQYTKSIEDQTPKNDTVHSGLSAQEVQNFLPSSVSEDNDGILGLQYQHLIPVLVKAIQELSAKVIALENA